MVTFKTFAIVKGWFQVVRFVFARRCYCKCAHVVDGVSSHLGDPWMWDRRSSVSNFFLFLLLLFFLLFFLFDLGFFWGVKDF